MRHEIQFEIHCGAECVIVQGPGSTAEDQGSPEASQAQSSHGPQQRAHLRVQRGGRTPTMLPREWGPGQCPHHSKAVPKDVIVPTGLSIFGVFLPEDPTPGQDSNCWQCPQVCPPQEQPLWLFCLCHSNRDLPLIWGRMEGGSFASWLQRSWSVCPCLTGWKYI